MSAYALIVEDGTALARAVDRGEIAAPDDDDMADKYLLADERLTAAGLGWYELSNWARRPASRCRHNELYWTGADWWGIGPGAHSHVGGVRWWNVRHPAAYAARLAAGGAPATRASCSTTRPAGSSGCCSRPAWSAGCRSACSTTAGRAELAALAAEGLVDDRPDRVVLTRRGRLLADAVVRRLLP